MPFHWRQQNAALVAVSTGLLTHMTRDEVEAVLGHEITHIANGDMVTLTLIQGVLNTFVIFLSRIIGQIVDRTIFQNERGYGMGYWITTIAAQLLLGGLASMIVTWFSRRREFRADVGGARLAGRRKIISALKRLQGQQDPTQLPAQLMALGISEVQHNRLMALFMSHPALSVRINALEQIALES
jgi:heat shock protein HtpX